MCASCIRAVRREGTITQTSASEASFFPPAPVRPKTLHPLFRAAMAAAMTFGEFPLVEIAIRQSPCEANPSTCLAKTRSKS